jgi:ketosteroid isomerase-like protein
MFSLMVAAVALVALPAMAQDTGQKSGTTMHKKDGKAAIVLHSDVKAEIMKIEKARDAAVVKGDVANLDAGSTSDYTIVTSDGVLNSKSQILDEFKSGRLKIASVNSTNTDVRVYGNSAVVSGISRIKGTQEGHDISGKLRYLRVYVKQNGKWLAVATQHTRIISASDPLGVNPKK